MRTSTSFGVVVRPRSAPWITALNDGWRCTHRQQPDRELDPAVGTWALELVVCWVATQRQAGGGDHELDPVRAH